MSVHHVLNRWIIRVVVGSPGFRLLFWCQRPDLSNFNCKFIDFPSLWDSRDEGSFENVSDFALGRWWDGLRVGLGFSRRGELSIHNQLFYLRVIFTGRPVQNCTDLKSGVPLSLLRIQFWEFRSDCEGVSPQNVSIDSELFFEGIQSFKDLLAMNSDLIAKLISGKYRNLNLNFQQRNFQRMSRLWWNKFFWMDWSEFEVKTSQH